MPRGSKESYSPKQRRMASHIESSVRSRGGSEEDAERIGWATVNKETGGAKRRKKSASSSRSASSGRSASSRSKSSSSSRTKKSASSGRRRVMH